LLRELRGAAVLRGAADPAVLVCCGLATLVASAVAWSSGVPCTGTTAESTDGGADEDPFSTIADPYQETVTAVDVTATQAPAYPNARRIPTP